ncbi:MAG: hypothetical protein CSA35_07800 [Dethiosulfovibrio peptidovorans]|nr:MAG: hypothetical protein CSA35_07800 [Dethiosulfovibrio peptidovorans]
MIVYELMTNGDAVRLPGLPFFESVPGVDEPRVVLLMPYNRLLVGFCYGGAYERWLWGKPGDIDSWQEAFIYDRLPSTFDTGDVVISVSSEVTSRLRSHLLSELPPPGNHGDTMFVLRDLLGAAFPMDQDDLWDDEEGVLASLFNLGEFRYLYWGVRKALSLGDHSMVGRVKIWARRGVDVFRDIAEPPKMWMSVGELPGNKGLAELESLLFKPEQLRRMNLEKSGSVVFRGDTGYLVRFEGQRPFGEIAVTVWMYFPTPIWEEMKDRRGLRAQEIVILSWGYLDALEATRELERYGRPQSLEEIIQVKS